MERQDDMATLGQVMKSPVVYGLKAISIFHHQSRILLSKILGIRFLFIDWLSRSGVVDIGDGKKIQFVASSQRSVGRAKQVLVKEPGTTEWILGFEEGSLFWDIGSNIGAYTMLAAKRRSARVLAFEPMLSTYHDLVMNIDANKLGDTVGGFCLAFTDDNSIDKFYIRNEEAGYSGNTFGQPIDQYGNQYDHTSTYQVLGISIDSFVSVFNLDVPNHIKIDVDGGELAIIHGASRTLSDKKLKTVLIELEECIPGRVEEATRLMGLAGFKVGRIDTLIEIEKEKTSNYIFVR